MENLLALSLPIYRNNEGVKINCSSTDQEHEAIAYKREWHANIYLNHCL